MKNRLPSAPMGSICRPQGSTPLAVHPADVVLAPEVLGNQVSRTIPRGNSPAGGRGRSGPASPWRPSSPCAGRPARPAPGHRPRATPGVVSAISTIAYIEAQMIHSVPRARRLVGDVVPMRVWLALLVPVVLGGGLSVHVSQPTPASVRCRWIAQHSYRHNATPSISSIPVSWTLPSGCPDEIPLSLTYRVYGFEFLVSIYALSL